MHVFQNIVPPLLYEDFVSVLITFLTLLLIQWWLCNNKHTRFFFVWPRVTLIPSVYLECFEQMVLPQLHVSVHVRAFISVNVAHNSRMWTNLSHAATCRTVSSFFLYTMFHPTQRWASGWFLSVRNRKLSALLSLTFIIMTDN